MKQKKLKLNITLLFVFATVALQAQTSVNSSGGNGSGSGGSVSYSVGQAADETYTSTSGSVAEGVQQTFQVSVITAVEQAKGINLATFPNPTADNLTLSIKGIKISNLSFQLYDVNGKILQSEKITDNQSSIAMSKYAAATYYLKLIQNNNEIKIFKIIKK